MKSSLLICSAVVFSLAACGPLKKEPKKDTTRPALAACSRAPTVGERIVGACELRLVSPKSCEEIDLTAGKAYEFVWAVDQTTCTAPFTLVVAGNPTDLNLRFNLRDFSVPTLKIALTAANVGGLTTNDSTFEWAIADANGSHPASRVFRIKR